MTKTVKGTLSAGGPELHRIAASAPRKFEVFGERSSGTNLINLLIRRHTVLQQSRNLGWKHGFAKMLAIAPDVVVVVCVRNALPWALSMYAKPWHATPDMQRLDFSQFIRAPWQSVIDRPRYFDEACRGAVGQVLQQDRDPVSGACFANLVKMRNSKTAALLGFRNRECNLILVRHETVLEDPAGFLAALNAGFGLPPAAPYKPVRRRLGSRFKASVELRPPVPDEISAADRKFILSQLDMTTEAELGYKY
ncbi:MAG: hypothetical protein ACC646_11450 [Paracoccaceae bacterium]